MRILINWLLTPAIEMTLAEQCLEKKKRKKMINCAGLQNAMLDGDDIPLKSYHRFLAKTMCNPFTKNCCMN